MFPANYFRSGTKSLKRAFFLREIRNQFGRNRQKSEIRKQKTEIRKQKTENRNQRSEIRDQIHGSDPCSLMPDS